MATKTNKFVEVDDSRAEAWKPTKPGDFIEGKYCGSVMVEGTVGDPFKSYRVKDAAGVMHGVSGATLEARMARIPGGAEIRVTFKGTQKSKRGSDMKLFGVAVAEGTTLREMWDGAGDSDGESAGGDLA